MEQAKRDRVADALESGKYNQGKGAHMRGVAPIRHCVTGVIYEVLTGKDCDRIQFPTGGPEFATIDFSMNEWLAHHQKVLADGGIELSLLRDMEFANDRLGWSFQQFADMFRKEEGWEKFRSEVHEHRREYQATAHAKLYPPPTPQMEEILKRRLDDMLMKSYADMELVKSMVDPFAPFAGKVVVAQTPVHATSLFDILTAAAKVKG